jgi:hypothetical protein
MHRLELSTKNASPSKADQNTACNHQTQNLILTLYKMLSLEIDISFIFTVFAARTKESNIYTHLTELRYFTNMYYQKFHMP